MQLFRNPGSFLIFALSASLKHYWSWVPYTSVFQLKSQSVSWSVMSDCLQPLEPTSLLCPWDSPGKNTGVGCHFLLQCMKVKVKSLSRLWLLATPWTAAHQAPLSMGFSRQEYWSGVPLPSPSHWLEWLKLKRKKTCKWVFSQVQKGMATHSSILVWKIPWTEGLGGLQSMGLQRAGHNWVTKTSPEALSSMVEQLQHDKTALETIWLVSGDG